MVDIKRARNDFYGFRATVPAAEFDAFMYVLDAAVSQYEASGSAKLEGAQKLVRAMSELAYFDKERREVHIHLGFRDLESFTQAMYDVMLPGFQADTDHTFYKCLERPGVKIWKTRQPAGESGK